MEDVLCEELLLDKSNTSLPHPPSVAQQLTCSGYLYHAGIPTLVERSFIILLFVVGILVGVTGNATVILASVSYRSFKMDKVTILFVKHLAISDIVYIVIFNLPLLLTNITKRWILGEVMCNVVGYGFMFPCCTSFNFILFISIHRYARCKWPIKAHLLTKERAHMMIIGTWLFVVLFWPLWVVLGDVPLEFNGNMGTCVYNFDYGNKPLHFALMLTPNISCIITIATNLGLWQIFRETRRKRGTTARHSKPNVVSVQDGALPTPDLKLHLPNKKKNELIQAILTTCSVSFFFLLAWIPISVRYTISAYPWEHIRCGVYWDKIIMVMYNISTWSNPVVYTIINKSFREFLIKRFNAKVQMAVSSASTVTSPFSTPMD